MYVCETKFYFSLRSSPCLPQLLKLKDLRETNNKVTILLHYVINFKNAIYISSSPPLLSFPQTRKK